MKAYIVKKYVLVHDWTPHPVSVSTPSIPPYKVDLYPYVFLFVSLKFVFLHSHSLLYVHRSLWFLDTNLPISHAILTCYASSYSGFPVYHIFPHFTLSTPPPFYQPVDPPVDFFICVVLYRLKYLRGRFKPSSLFVRWEKIANRRMPSPLGTSTNYKLA